MGRLRSTLPDLAALALAGGILALVAVLLWPDTSGDTEVRAQASPSTSEGDVDLGLSGRARAGVAEGDTGSVVALVEAPSWPPPADALFPPPTGARLARLLAEIESPSEPVNTDCLTPFGGGADDPEDLQYHGRVFRRAWWAVDALQHAGPEVGPTLLRLALEHDAWDVRCRAAEALLLCRHAEAVAVLAGMLESAILAERYVAWRLAEAAVEADLGRAATTREALTALDGAKHEDLARVITNYVGNLRDPAASATLMRRIDQDAPASRYAVYALGSIGESRAVSMLIASSGSADCHPRFQALAQIGTEAAIDHLVAALEGPDAGDAAEVLADVVTDCATDGLRRLQARVDAGTVELDSYDREDLAYSLLAHEHPDPCPVLLARLEDEAVDLETKRDAARRLCWAGPDASLHPRIAAVYRAATDHEIRHRLQWTLEDSRAPGVTEAMLHHALTWHWPGTLKGGSSQEDLVHALNRRLGTGFESLEDVKAFAEARGLTS